MWFVIFILTAYMISVTNSNICTEYYAERTKYYTSCGFFDSCSRYRYSHQTRQVCCSGYTHYPNCYPVCNGKTVLENACDEAYNSDKIIYRGNSSRNSGGGTCSSPENCANCQDGFYASGNRCLICPVIANCNHRRCSSPSDNFCNYCQYEIKDKEYWRGYTRHYDGHMKECRKACSWRADSTRCYPGNCTNEIVETCSCTSGFGGSQCDRITEETAILYAEIKLHNPSKEIVTTPLDPSDTGPQPIRFTNKADLNSTEIEFRGKFVASGTPPALDPDHFVTEFRYGIVYGQMKLQYTTNSTLTTLTYSCPATEDFPINVNYDCSRTRKNDSDIMLPSFDHSEQLVFTIDVRNGGYLKYVNRENNSGHRVSLTGITTTRSYTVQWDYVTPYYSCFQQFGDQCSDPSVVIQDVTDQNVITFSWKQWADDLAGIASYEYEVYYLTPSSGTFLKEADRLTLNSTNPSMTEGVINVTSPGMYSIILSAFDKAGNYKSTRSVFLFDDQSIVELVHGARMIVAESTVETNHTWVVSDTTQLNVVWSGRFMNQRHELYRYLQPVASHKHVETSYDDMSGRRTVEWVTNVKGVVKFDVNYTISGPDVTSSQNFQDVANILPEKETINITWEDGQKIDISVRATDLIGEYIDDTITVYRDTTQPVIEDLWLTYGNKTELYVHHIEDFTSMTFEWNSFDYHSGIHSVRWKLYDNYTGSEVIHGISHIHAQGNVNNITHCEDEYQYTPRGPDCYCTLYHGCFHRHFHVTPEIVHGSGLTPGKDRGVHDSDYFIEITVTNKAMLTSVFTKKITVDTSAPQSGFVHDGISGSPEIDYQQDLQLNAYWDGFFDPESGVSHYKYIFADTCFNRQALIDSKQGKETFNTLASYTASGEGTYYVTVIAMNEANSASRAVCSDGVTVTTTIPTVKNFILSDARTYPRLVRDPNNTRWIVDKNINRTFVNSSDNCSGIPYTDIADIKLFPEDSPTEIACTSLLPKNKMFLFILPRSFQLTMNWEPDVGKEMIYDYHVGLSSTKDSMSPDIVGFRSTKHHQHLRLNSPDVSEGNIFYVVIQTISKADIEGIQSFGPIIIDGTPPKVSASDINVQYMNGALIANWSSDAFQDDEDPYPLSFQYSLGHSIGGAEVGGFRPLSFNTDCEQKSPPDCTAIQLDSLEWSLHGHHEYYVTIKATNLVGLTSSLTSKVYRHDIFPPSPGVVFDVVPATRATDQLQDIRDVDFTVMTDALSVEWRDFYHPHLKLKFNVCVGTTEGSCDVAVKTNLDESIFEYTFNNLKLSKFQKYFGTVEAVTSAGTVKVSSDGITVIDNSTEITGLIINDGKNCPATSPLLNGSHHARNVIGDCQTDVDYQTSTTTLTSHWEIPVQYQSIVRNAFVSIDKKSSVGDFWSQYRDFTYIGNHHTLTVSQLDLQPGLTYRSSVKLCADNVCFPTSHSNGVVVIPNKPVTGTLDITLENSKMKVIFHTMYDPDIEDRQEAMDAVQLYEWAIVDGSKVSGMYENWKTVDNLQTYNDTHSYFEISMPGEIDFSKCKKISFRGINKAGVWSEVSKEIKKCHVTDSHSYIRPKTIIDAFGMPDMDLDDGVGKGISFQQNTVWESQDVDYTPYKNILSAVWPTLRHKNYTWGVIEAGAVNAETFYKDFTDLYITDPCSHPDNVKCGNTVKNFINVQFNESEYLSHGKRYIVCLFAPETTIGNEKWTEVLSEVNTCSDGVTVDLTPPVAGDVWIGNDPQTSYQTSSSDIVVTWDSFVDVEEYGQSIHASGISEYLVSVGSIDGGVDIVDKEKVGLTNRISFHSLNLQNGHQYFATVTGYDYINRSTEIRSSPILVDVTPPEITDQPILINGRILSNISEMEACWTDVFMDVQSGIQHYMWGVGSLSGQDDLIPFSKTTQECSNSLTKSSYLKEGHAYFITVKAFNRAGLFTTRSSWAYIHDVSPPIKGHVFDGKYNTLSSQKDIDYQTDLTQLSVHWEGFNDPHSVIKSYSVHIGTCLECDDIISKQYVGMHTDLTLVNLDMQPGVRYYSTVTACNTANLCTTAVSDGIIVDNSPPVPGIVQDGTGDFDIEYQSIRNYLSAKWYGFTDSQSGIHYYVIRAGTSPGSENVLSSMRLTETDEVFLTDFPTPLPLNQRIYITIRVFNNVGLFTEATSNGFYIDISAPVVIRKPYLARDFGSIIEDTTIVRSAIKFRWEVEDSQSYIQNQFVSLATHKGGELNDSVVAINGILREYTFTNIKLHDGGIYFIKLIVCNGAKICTEASSAAVLVDTTPPITGMFAIWTYHAAELQRHTSGWMTWDEYKLNISLVGFTDLHSSIDKYFISVGSEYMSNDLNKVPGNAMEFTHNESGIQYRNEGPLQYFIVPTQLLTNFEHVFLSVWAVNKVGLSSPMIHYQFQLIPGGFLDLIRRCSAVTCMGHCVCAARDNRCSSNGNLCSGGKNALLNVKDITDFTRNVDVNFTPANSYLSATWDVQKQQGLSPKWYEWSVGLTSENLPEGVIDTTVDTLWHHAGGKTEALYCIKQGLHLSDYLTYSVFVRAWYNDNAYEIFKSSGVTILSKPLQVNDQRGAAVTEKMPSHWKSDVDFIKPGELFTVDWSNVFLGKPGSIRGFNVYLSSFPEGADLHKVNLDLPASVSAVNISRLTMSPSVRYYSNVVGKTYAGLTTTVSSDGIMVDSDKPIGGIVCDGLGLHDLQYQNKSDVVSASWHGFTDTESGIVQYSWCVGSNSAHSSCDILPWTHVGMHTSVSKKLSESVLNGKIVYSKIKSVDGVGHVSEIKSSNGVTIDVTPPEPVYYIHSENNVALNPSFENTYGCYLNMTDISSFNLCENDPCYQPETWNTTGCTAIVYSDKDTAYDGRSFAFIKGSMEQDINHLSPGRLYRASFVVSHLPLTSAVISNIEGSIQLGGQHHVFHIYTKKEQNQTVWHPHIFYFRPASTVCTLTINSLGRNSGFFVDDIKVQVVETSSEEKGGQLIHVHTVGLHQWSSIHAAWNFADPESHIKEYLWAIGSEQGNAEIQSFESVGTNNFGYNYNLTLVHSSQVYISVIAVNNAGLYQKAYSVPISIDNTPPVIQYINDGTGVDIDGQTSNIISANWKVTDPESGIQYCEWAIGTQPYGNEMQYFTVTSDINSASSPFPENDLLLKTVHVTVRCHNNAGSYVTGTSDGVTISDVPPSSDNAVVEVIPLSKTEYRTSDYHQRDKTKIRMKWSGFIDRFDIMSFVVQFAGGNFHLKNSLLDINKDVSYMTMTGLDLSDESYTSGVAAINAMYMRSSKINTNITIQSFSPVIKDNPNVSFRKYGNDIRVDWDTVFTYTGRLYYEVSVGTTLGGADVIQWQETTNNYLIVEIPEKLKTLTDLNLFFYIRAIGDNGEFTPFQSDVIV